MAEAKSSPLAAGAYLAFVAGAAVAVYSFVSVAKDGELRRNCSAMCLARPAYAGADRKAPSFTLPDMNGNQVSLASFKNKVVVVNFWTKTCGPCMQEMPELADLARVLRDRSDVAVITISADSGPDDVRDSLAAALSGKEAPFPVLFDPELAVIGAKFGTRLFPETWIIDKNGVIRVRVDGARAWANAAIVELVDDLRGGGYCPVEIKEGRTSGRAARLCDELNGGS